MKAMKGVQYIIRNCGSKIDGLIIKSLDGDDTFIWVTHYLPHTIGTICHVSDMYYLTPLLTIKEL